MTFYTVENTHKHKELVSFSLIPELVQNREQKQGASLLSQSGQPFNNYYKLHLNVFFGEIPSLLSDKRNFVIRIQRGYLELNFENAKLPEEYWIVATIDEVVTRKGKTTSSKNNTLGASFPIPKIDAKTDRTTSYQEDVEIELRQVNMTGEPENVKISFTSQQQDQDGNYGFLGKFSYSFKELEVWKNKSVIEGRFFVDSSGLCVIHSDGKPIEANLGRLIIRSLFTPIEFPSLKDKVKSTINNLEGELSYVKLCSQ
jgi:hypothetical protein